MSCEKLYFENISCSNTKVTLGQTQSISNYTVVLKHTGNGKDYWFTTPNSVNLTIDLSGFNVDTDVPYEFTVYDTNEEQGEIIPFGAFGATSWTYEHGVFSFSPSKSIDATLSTEATLQAK